MQTVFNCDKIQDPSPTPDKVQNSLISRISRAPFTVSSYTRGDFLKMVWFLWCTRYIQWVAHHVVHVCFLLSFYILTISFAVITFWLFRGPCGSICHLRRYKAKIDEIEHWVAHCYTLLLAHRVEFWQRAEIRLQPLQLHIPLRMRLFINQSNHRVMHGGAHSFTAHCILRNQGRVYGGRGEQPPPSVTVKKT